MQQKIIGIMGAMPEEVLIITTLLTERQEHEIGGRVYHVGLLNNIKTVVVFSRWGKVAAATTVTTMKLKFGITELLFTGVAGAIDSKLAIGDIVIAQKLFQHDMDGRPLMQQFEIPLLGVRYFEGNEIQIQYASMIIKELLQKNHLEKVITPKELSQFGIHQPRLHIGDIASGDKFFSSNEDKAALRSALPSVLCVEMEGAAVAQVCFEHQIPFTIIRTISDVADESSALDFPSFIQHISSKYSLEIVKLYFSHQNQ
ncbi:MAG: 5'-methylthioadenosine/adenosylhomocysteine nucleosidase [Bacteroidia bacterium]|nr:5'-methylthioadenosine/adenosylhomocysteine nucleosidase [Bacteroidia bacterium]